MSGDRKCFQITILNDNISEPVETFLVSLDTTLGENVTITNHSITVVIVDDGECIEEALSTSTCFNYSNVDYTEMDPESSCSINGYLLTDKIREEREEVVTKIRKLLPIALPSLSPRDGGESLEETYVQLAVHFDRPITPEGRAKFTAAMDEIFSTYSEECSGEVAVPDSHAITELATSFKELTRRLTTISTEDLSKVRAIYGRFLCYSESEETSSRRRRQIVTECECPGEVTLSCHFYACLTALEIETIIGFGTDIDRTPCIGFAVDTTGSMGGEIASARRVILEFIKTQADNTWCYVLVPFNDLGVGHPMSEFILSQSKGSESGMGGWRRGGGGGG